MFLDLAGNRLEGEIPHDLGQLAWARYVRTVRTSFADNRLTGCIPARLYLRKYPRVFEDLPCCSWGLDAPATGGAGLLGAREPGARAASHGALT